MFGILGYVIFYFARCARCASAMQAVSATTTAS